MKIHILSDLHLEFSEPTENFSQVDSDVVVLAGDIHVGTSGLVWAAKTWPNRPVLYVPGNHEYYRREYHAHQIAMRAVASKYSNIVLLDRDAVVIDDVLFAGATLWTDFQYFQAGDAGRAEKAMLYAKRSMNDFLGAILNDRDKDSRSSMFTPADSVNICALDHAFFNDLLSKDLAALGRQFAARSIRKRVVISHHLPTARSVSERYRNDDLTPAFASQFDETVKLADLWIHGHTHDSKDFHLFEKIDGQVTECARVVCNPRGYSHHNRPVENTKFDPYFVVEI